MDGNDSSAMEADIIAGNSGFAINCSGHEILEVRRIILAPCILIINCIFLTIFLYKKKIRTAADVPFYSMCVLSILFSIYLMFPVGLFISHWPCHIINNIRLLVIEFFLFVAGLHVALIGLDRYLAVAYILQWHSQRRKSRLYGFLASIWVSSTIIYGSIMLTFILTKAKSSIENDLDKNLIIDHDRLYLILKSINFSLACLIPFIIIIFMFILCVKVTRTGQYGQRSTRLCYLKKRRKKKIIRGVYMILCYICLRFPYAVFNFTEGMISPSKSLMLLQQIFQNLAVGYFLVHPFIYSYLTYRLRKRVFIMWYRSQSTSLSQLLSSFPIGA